MAFLNKALYILRHDGVEIFFRRLLGSLSRKILGKSTQLNMPLPPEPIIEALGINMHPRDFRPATKNDTSSRACEYYSAWSQLVALGKNSPEELVVGIAKSGFYLRGEFSNLHRALLAAFKEMIQFHEDGVVQLALSQLREVAPELLGSDESYRLFSHLDLLLGVRKKITIGIYDQAFQFAGGGQRYMAALAELLQDKYDITYISNKGGSLQRYKEWFDIDVSRCHLKNIPLQFFDERGSDFIDEGMVSAGRINPFEVIAQESVNYDVFINANMLSMVEPRSIFSIFIGHFPDRDIGHFFSVPKYDFLIGNGDYSCYWLKKRWNIEPTHKLYPPVNMFSGLSSAENKKKIILSAARFEVGGSKKQLEMVKAFDELARQNPEIEKEWKLVLVGGSFENNRYFKAIEKQLRKSVASIELRPNAEYSELKNLYCEAAIFWHACGLNETLPHLIEHFGMTTVEAMQNHCVPIVIDGGGQKEIVVHEKNGFRFSSLDELKVYTLNIIQDVELRKHLAGQAYKRGHDFDLTVFNAHVLEIFEEIENELLTLQNQ